VSKVQTQRRTGFRRNGLVGGKKRIAEACPRRESPDCGCDLTWAGLDRKGDVKNLQCGRGRKRHQEEHRRVKDEKTRCPITETAFTRGKVGGQGGSPGPSQRHLFALH